MPASLQRVLGPWRPGDLDGCLALGLNNLIQILLIISLCRGVLGYPDALVFGTILPAGGVSLLVGNLAYSHLAPPCSPPSRASPSVTSLSGFCCAAMPIPWWDSPAWR